MVDFAKKMTAIDTEDTVSIKLSKFAEEEPPPKVEPPVKHAPSPQQSAVYEWIQRGKGNLILESRAGTGKTTTIIDGLPYMTGWVDIAAFNRKIADEIKGKINGYSRVMAGTFHSFGFQAWKKVAPGVKVEGLKTEGRFPEAGYWKFDRIQTIMAGEEKRLDLYPAGPVLDYHIQPVYRAFVKAMLSMVKQRGLGVDKPITDSFDEMRETVSHFDLEELLADDQGNYVDVNCEHMIERGLYLAAEALRVSCAIAREVIDHDDMLFMPVFSKCRMFQVDWLLVDEAQDSNPIRRMFGKRMIGPYSRTIWVGDPQQAINGFTGADNDALDLIERDFRCTRLPLTVSFRCSKAAIKLAQQWVPDIEAAPNAKEGEHITTPLEKFMEDQDTLGGLDHNSVILCRKNAPLVEVAFALIRKGVPCYVEGRDIGANLIDLVTRWKVANLSLFAERLQAYRVREVGKLMNQGKDAMADIVSDRVDTLLAVMKGLPAGANVSDLRTRITSMFQDSTGNRKPCLTLSSVHKSKGREWDNVYILGRAVYMPSKFARQQWQQDQERNLMYVAVTRSKDRVIDLTIPPPARRAR